MIPAPTHEYFYADKWRPAYAYAKHPEWWTNACTDGFAIQFGECPCGRPWRISFKLDEFCGVEPTLDCPACDPESWRVYQSAQQQPCWWFKEYPDGKVWMRGNSEDCHPPRYRETAYDKNCSGWNAASNFHKGFYHFGTHPPTETKNNDTREGSSNTAQTGCAENTGGIPENAGSQPSPTRALTQDPQRFRGHLKKCAQEARTDYQYCSCWRALKWPLGDNAYEVLVPYEEAKQTWDSLATHDASRIDLDFENNAGGWKR